MAAFTSFCTGSRASSAPRAHGCFLYLPVPGITYWDRSMSAVRACSILAGYMDGGLASQQVGLP